MSLYTRQFVKSYLNHDGAAVCKTDNLDLIKKSAAGVTLTSTAMNSLEDKSVYFGKNAQWASLLDKGCIKNTICFQEEKRILDVDLVFAKRQEQITHKFCFAVNTGTCSASNIAGSVPVTWDKDDFCSNWLHPHPHLIPRPPISAKSTAWPLEGLSKAGTA